MRISDWSSDVCSSDLVCIAHALGGDLGALADHQTGTGPLSVVDAHQVVGQVARLARAHPGQWGHEDTVGGAHRTEVERLEQARHGIHAGDRKSTRLNSNHYCAPRMPSSA